jgi:protein-disulfide isomerase
MSGHERRPSWRRDLIITVLLIAGGVAIVVNRIVTLSRPPAVVLTLEEPKIGSPIARVGMMVFADFECPFSRRFASEVLSTLTADYLAGARLLIAFRHYPLAAKHPGAVAAAEGAECARERGRFWPMHDALFRQPRLTDDAIVAAWQMAGLQPADLHSCVRTRRANVRVNADFAAGKALGVRSTPTFVLGTVGEDGRLMVSRLVSGLRSAEELVGVLDEISGDRR